MPVFQDAACPENGKLPKDLPEDFPENLDLCVEVLMPNSEKDMLVLSQVLGTSIYEGYLRNEVNVPVVLIDVPLTKKRVVSFSFPITVSLICNKMLALVEIAIILYPIDQLHFRQNPKLQLF